MEKINLNKPYIVLGAGPAGLASAYKLISQGYDVVILEREPRVGGLSASMKIKDYIVDYGPHSFHLKKSEITNFVEKLCGDELNKVSRICRLILDGKNLQFPLQIREAILKINPILSLKILSDYLKANFFLKKLDPNESFESWGIKNFGYSLYRLAFANYSEKMWGLPGNQLSYHLAQQKLLKLNSMVLTKALFGRGSTELGLSTSALYDAYHKQGIGTIFEKIAEIIKSKGGQIYLESEINRIITEGNLAKAVEFESKGKRYKIECSSVISSVPLPSLVKMLKSQLNEEIYKSAQNLKYRALRVVYLVINKDRCLKAHWIYLIDNIYHFNRISEQKNMNIGSSPPGRTVLGLDISCNFGDTIWKLSSEDLMKMALNDLRHLGIKTTEIIDCFEVKAKDAYPVYDLMFKTNINNILEEIKKIENLFSIGRQGLFLNNDTHDSMEMGFMVCDYVSNKKAASYWYQDIQDFIQIRLEGIVKNPWKV